LREPDEDRGRRQRERATESVSVHDPARDRAGARRSHERPLERPAPTADRARRPAPRAAAVTARDHELVTAHRGPPLGGVLLDHRPRTYGRSHLSAHAAARRISADEQPATYPAAARGSAADEPPATSPGWLVTSAPSAPGVWRAPASPRSWSTASAP